MTESLYTHLRRTLLTALDLPAPVRVEPLHSWRLSNVERLHLPDRPSVIFKCAGRPFTEEHHTLGDLAAQGIPVPPLRAAKISADTLGMILDDLGQSAREPSEHDAATAAAFLHNTAKPPSWLEPLDEHALTALPKHALACLEHLRARGRFPNTEHLRSYLDRLDQCAATRAAGATQPPFGLCHGELHPSAFHMGATSWHLLDFAMAMHGPGLLDLASWFGLRRPPNPEAMRRLIEQYVRAGGNRQALNTRGDLSAERWALGWHRVHAAHWLLNCGATGIDEPVTDERHIHVLGRQLAGAVDLLGV